MRPHAGLRRRIVTGDSGEQRLVGTAPAIEHGINQGVFAAETVLHPALGDPHRFGDGVNGQAGGALGGDDLFGGVQNFVAIDAALTSH